MADISTTIEQNTLIEGRVSGGEDIEVLGRVDGTIELDATLFVEEPGIVVGEAKVSQAVVSGTFVGTLTASDYIQVAETGRVVGELVAPRILVEEGAAIDATLTTDESAPAPAERPRRAAPAAKPERPAPRPAPRPAARRSKPTAPKKKARRSAPARPAPAKAKPAVVEAPVSETPEATE